MSRQEWKKNRKQHDAQALTAWWPWGEVMKNSTCHCHDWLIDIQSHRKNERERCGGERLKLSGQDQMKEKRKQRVRNGNSRKRASGAADGRYRCDQTVVCVSLHIVYERHSSNDRFSLVHVIVFLKWKHGTPLLNEKRVHVITLPPVSGELSSSNRSWNVT